jgi:hypothetical protein
MRPIRVVLVGIVVGALATAGACTTSKTRPTISPLKAGASPSPAEAADPADSMRPLDVVIGATAKTRDTTLKYTVDIAAGSTVVLHGTGVIDAGSVRQSGTITETLDGSTSHEQAIAIGTDLYVKDDDHRHWLHADATRFAPEEVPAVGDLRDPTGLRSYGRAVASARRTGNRQYEGMLDYLQAPPETRDLGVPLYMGPRTPVPFTAAIDEQDRLNSIVIKIPPIPGVPALTVTVHYTGFGVPVTIEAPPAAQIDTAPKDRFPPIP